MIVKSSSPCRISLFCGGTDLPSYVEKFGGIAISLAVNLRQYISLYTDEDSESIAENSFPLGITPATPEFLTKFLEEAHLEYARVVSTSDAYLGSGLGTSAAAAVAMIGAIAKTRNMQLTSPQIVQEAWSHENHGMGWFGGKQDQIASVYGGVNLIEFKDNTLYGFTLSPFERTIAESLASSLVLYYVGERKIKGVQEIMRELSNEQIESLHLMKEMTTGAINYIIHNDYEHLGKLLDTYWKQKKKSNPNMTNLYIDEIYEKAKDAGAYGGKITGAGAGGYMVFIVEPSKKQEFIATMSAIGMDNVDFSISYDGLQTRRL